MVLAVGLLINDMTFFYLRFNNKPNINVRNKRRFITEIPYPAITLCNPLFARDSLVRFYNITRRSRINPNEDLNLTIQEQNYLSSNIQACSADNAEFLKRDVSRRTEYDTVKLLEESSLSTSEAFLACMYGGNAMDCNKILNRVLTDRGFCYSFNMQGFNDIFNEHVISKDFYNYKRTTIAKSLNVFDKLNNETVTDRNSSLQWSLDQGFDDFHPSDAVPVKAGKKKVVGLILFLKEVDATNVCTLYGNVFSILLHLPNEIMLPQHLETYVEFSRKKDIILTAKSYTADERLRKYEPVARGCYFEGEKQLKFFKTYTKALCEFECMTNYTLTMCGCVRFSMPRTNSTRVCSMEETTCYQKAITDWPDRNLTKNRFNITCGCLKTCNFIKYEIKFEKLSTVENVIVLADILNVSKGFVLFL